MTVRLLAFAAVLAVFGNSMTAQEKKADPSAQEKKMMDDMMKFAQPGEPHKVFEHFAGKWTYTGKWYMPSGAHELSGKSEAEIIMKGRYLADHTWSDDAEKTFEGRGWWAYDNVKKKYFYSWIDSMGTGITTGEGTWDAKTKTLTWMSEAFDPMQGKTVKMKETSVVKGDTIEKTFYALDSGKETKAMELHLKRAK